MKLRSKSLRGTPSVKMLRAGRTAIASSTQNGLRPRPMNIKTKLTAIARRATTRSSTLGRAGIGPGSAGTGAGSAVAAAIGGGVYTLPGVEGTSVPFPSLSISPAKALHDGFRGDAESVILIGREEVLTVARDVGGTAAQSGADATEHIERGTVEHPDVSAEGRCEENQVMMRIDQCRTHSRSHSTAQYDFARVQIEDVDAPESRGYQALILLVDGHAIAARVAGRADRFHPQASQVQLPDPGTIGPLGKKEAVSPLVNRLGTCHEAKVHEQPERFGGESVAGMLIDDARRPVHPEQGGGPLAREKQGVAFAVIGIAVARHVHLVFLQQVVIEDGTPKP